MKTTSAISTVSRLDLCIAIGFVSLLGWWLVGFYQDFGFENQQFAKGVCCGFTDPVFDAVVKIERGDTVDYVKGYAAYLGTLWWNLHQREPYTLMWMSHWAHGLTGALAFMFGVIRKRPFVGVLSATAICLAPINLYSSLRWDVYSLQGPILLIGWMSVYWSRGFTRILPTASFVGIVWASAFWSFRETDNLILLLSHASLAFGSWVSALIRGRDEQGNPISRPLSTILALGSCIFILWQISIFWRFSSPEGLQYYFREAENPMMEPQIQLTPSLRWFGYWGHIYWRAFGPALTSLVVAAIGVSLVLRRFSWGLLCGVLIPYVALSWISKRNFYYPSTLWVLLPLLAGEGLMGVSKEWLRKVLCGISVAICCWNLYPRLDGSELVGDDQYGGVFQTSDNDITLLPKRLFGVNELSHAIQSYLPPAECHAEQIVLMEKNAISDEIAIRASQSNPCTIFKRQLQRIGPNVKERSIPVWVRDPKQTDVTESWLEEQGFVVREEVLMENRFRLEIWVK